MCIRDRCEPDRGHVRDHDRDDHQRHEGHAVGLQEQHREQHRGCLLYTSDAADERSSVDLGGRRIIKKKKQKDRQGQTYEDKEQNIYNDDKELAHTARRS